MTSAAVASRLSRVLFVVVASGCANGSNHIHVPDVPLGPDAGAEDAFVAHPDAFVSQMDMFVPPVDAFVPPPDMAMSIDMGRDTGSDVGLDAGTDVGPVDAYRPDAGPCMITHLLISEVRSRGAGGAADEFIELYNPTAAAIALDSSWTIQVRSSSSTSFTARWSGTGTMIPASGHFLITGTGYTQTPAGDGMLSSGITDAGSIQLMHAMNVVDTLCYAYSAATVSALGAAGYACEGMPFGMNPHNNGTGTDVDASIERLPGGTAGNCVDTDMNSSDFQTIAPALPQSSTSPMTP